MQTMGSKKLKAWLAKHTQEELAARLRENTGARTNQSTVSAWASGKSTPRFVMTIALRSICRIPIEAWATPSGAPRDDLKATG